MTGHGARDEQVPGALSSLGWSALLVALVWWFTVVAPDRDQNFTLQSLPPLAAVVLTVSSVGLVLRRRSAVVAMLLTVGADLCSVLWDLEGLGYHFGGMFGVFFVAMRYPLAHAVLLVVGPMGLVYLAEVQNAGWRWLAFAPTWVVLSTALAIASGQVRFLREHLVRSLQDRVASAEAAQDAVARARVAEDRLRTARELHDVVGHRIAVVHLRAAVAIRALEDDPNATRQALADIDEAARAALGDIDHLLANLRAGDPAPPAQHDLRDLNELIEDFHRYGLATITRINGDLTSVPSTVSAVAYHAADETLTNALKHGGPEPTADLTLTVRPGKVMLHVTNPCPLRSSSHRTGWGLHGLRERVASAGGTLEVAQADDFVVDVSLPTGTPP